MELRSHGNEDTGKTAERFRGGRERKLEEEEEKEEEE